MIMEQDTEHQAFDNAGLFSAVIASALSAVSSAALPRKRKQPLLASTMASLGDEYLQRCGLLELSRQKH